MVRISAILLIRKIFVACVRLATTLLLVIILYGLVVFLETFLICRPMAVDWNTHINGTCGNQVVSYLVLEIIGLLLDLAILILPLPWLWRLRMPFRRKLSVSISLSIGFL